MSFQGNKDVRVQGSSISLAPTGVSPGTYNLVTVDLNGRVTVGGGSGGTPVSGTITVALSGDASGSASGSGASPTITVPVALDTVNSNVGTFQGITVNGKGLVTAAVNENYFNVVGAGLTAVGNTVSVYAGQVPGTNTNNNASAGNVGEYVSSQVLVASAVAITTTNTAQNLTSISLTAGDWDVGGSVYFPTNGATVSYYESGISSNSVTLPDGSLRALTGPDTGTTDQAMAVPTQRFSLSGTTTVYLIVEAGFSAGNPKAAGYLWARRAR